MGEVHELRPKSRVLPPPTVPMEVARAFVAAAYTHPGGHRLLHCHRGSWLEWRSSHWAELELHAVRERAYAFTEQADYFKGPKTEPWAPTRHKIANLLDALAAVCHLDGELE